MNNCSFCCGVTKIFNLYRALIGIWLTVEFSCRVEKRSRSYKQNWTLTFESESVGHNVGVLVKVQSPGVSGMGSNIDLVMRVVCMCVLQLRDTTLALLVLFMPQMPLGQQVNYDPQPAQTLFRSKLDMRIILICSSQSCFAFLFSSASIGLHAFVFSFHNNYFFPISKMWW